MKKEDRHKFASAPIIGKIRGNRKGFAFLIRDDGQPDCFVPPSGLNGAQHDDTVQCVIVGGDEVRVVKILKRGMTKLIGTFYKSAYGYCYCIPDNKNYMTDIFIPDPPENVSNNTKIEVEITAYDDGKQPFGRISEILGTAGSVRTECVALLRSAGFFENYPAEVERAAEKSVKKIDRRSRRDYTDVLTFTIDGEDAKDFDDAISISRTDGVYELFVHIADVSHYVTENSIVDKEAYNRGTSVYFPGKAYPMLPEVLSNGVCSLNPGVERAVLTVEMKIDADGNVIDSRINTGIIKSDYRMTYSQVSAILNNDEVLCKEYEPLVPALRLAAELADILRKKRRRGGSIDFGNHDCNIILNKRGLPAEITLASYDEANGLIEEFMLLANETVAVFADDNDIPIVFRVHDEPPAEKMTVLQNYLKSCGIKMPGGDVTPKTLSSLLSDITHPEAYAVISEIAVRCMAKAEYSADDSGHFGLAIDNYCHFTSPIRRYPDLIVHRQIKLFLSGELTEKIKQQKQDEMVSVAEHCTERERAAEICERDVDDFYKALFMMDKLGHTFVGTVSGVTSFGLFVQLENTVEGLIPIEDFGLSARFYENSFELTARGKVYRIGDKLTVAMVSASTEDRKVRFTLAEHGDDAVPTGRKPMSKATEKTPSSRSAHKKNAKKSANKNTRESTARFVRKKGKSHKKKHKR